MSTVRVELGDRSYDVVVEPGARRDAASRIRAVTPASGALIIADDAVADTHAADVRASFGCSPSVVTLPADEKHKSLDAVRTIYDAALQTRLERRGVMVAVGGGVVGDIAGFAAATYLRGVDVVQLPTTLLAMVDASVGGKTGVNFPLPDGELGKNLIGGFWQPRLVLADPETLATLPPRDFRCGLAECVKHAVIADAALLDQIERDADAILTLQPDALTTLIHRCVAIKAEVVAADERESGRRALLNLGHTFAHAIEPIAALDLRHGEAVSIGLAAAAHVAVERGDLDAADARRVADLLARLELPVRLPDHAPAPDVLRAAMAFDKKVVDGRIRLVLPRGIGDAFMTDDTPEDLIDRAWRAVGAAAS